MPLSLFCALCIETDGQRIFNVDVRLLYPTLVTTLVLQHLLQFVSRSVTFTILTRRFLDLRIMNPADRHGGDIDDAGDLDATPHDDTVVESDFS